MPETPTPRIAAAYIRASTAMQDDSPETQRHVIEEWAALNGYAIPQDLWFVDTGVSGGMPFNKRPSGGKLLALVTLKHRPFDAIIIVRLDRAFRGVVDQGHTLAYLDKHGCRLLGARQDIAADTAAQRLMLNMVGGFSQYEREITGERIKEKNKSRHEKNLHPSGFPPYGLRIGATSNEPFVIVEAELARAIRVFELFASTCGNQNQTAKALNAEGVPPRRGTRWTATMVRNCVTRPGYRRMGFYDGEMRPKPDIIPATIPDELLARVDAILTAQYGHWHVRSGDGQHSRPTATYTGLVACAVCGEPMDINIKDGNQKTPTPYFRCRARNNGCASPGLHAPTVDRLVGECLLLGLEVFAADVKRQPLAQRAKASRVDAAERIAELEESRAVAVDLVMLGRKGGGIDMAEFQVRAARIDAEIAELSATVTEAPVPTMPPEVARTYRERWSDFWPAGIYSAGKREILTTVFGVSRGGIVLGKAWKAKSHRTTNAVWSVAIKGTLIYQTLTWTGSIGRGKMWVPGGQSPPSI